jgi:effector-binding domain-containing protein
LQKKKFMQIKTRPAMRILYYSTKTTLAGLHALTGNVAMSLYEAAVNAKLLVSGPVYWLYYGADGKPDTEFTLEIAIPVNGEPEGETVFEMKTVPAFRCVTVTHDGDWSGLGSTYGKAIAWLQSEGLNMKAVNECREMYVNMDFADSSNNITEVQIGIE